MNQELDRKDLKSQALLEKVSQLTTQYENQIADLRVELTVVQYENENLRQELESTKSEETDAPEKKEKKSS